MNIKTIAALTGLLLGGAAPVLAEEAPKDFVTFTGAASLVSDYRFRGASLSNTDAAIQGTITANTSPGFYVGMWGSSIATYGGANTEIDVYGGWTGPVGPVTGQIGIYSYLYPGGNNVDVYEIYGSVAKTFGPVGLTFGVNYAPDQSNLYRDNIYLFTLGTFGIADTPITLKGSIGYEHGSFASGATFASESKVDYMVGVDFKYKAVTLGLQYIGNDVDKRSLNRSNTKGRFVVSLTGSF